MKAQEIFRAHPKTPEQVGALKAFTRSLKIRFGISNTANNNVNFVKKILDSFLEANVGKATRKKKKT